MNDDDVDPGARDADASLDEHEVDPLEVDRDDELLDTLGRGERPDVDDPLLALFADWRAETGSAELPALPSDEEIEVALAPNVSRLRPRRGGEEGEPGPVRLAVQPGDLDALRVDPGPVVGPERGELDVEQRAVVVLGRAEHRAVRDPRVEGILGRDQLPARPVGGRGRCRLVVQRRERIVGGHHRR